MIPSAEIVHRVNGRLRLRVPERRGDAPWFAATRKALAGFPGVLRVTANPDTGSFLIRGKDLALRRIPEIAEDRGWFALSGPDRSRRPAGDALAGLAPVFFGLAALQAARGQIMVPALSLLWYALEIVRWEELRGDR
jgi:hypothetical protein